MFSVRGGNQPRKEMRGKKAFFLFFFSPSCAFRPVSLRPSCKEEEREEGREREPRCPESCAFTREQLGARRRNSSGASLSFPLGCARRPPPRTERCRGGEGGGSHGARGTPPSPCVPLT